MHVWCTLMANLSFIAHIKYYMWRLTSDDPWRNNNYFSIWTGQTEIISIFEIVLLFSLMTIVNNNSYGRIIVMNNCLKSVSKECPPQLRHNDHDKQNNRYNNNIMNKIMKTNYVWKMDICNDVEYRWHPSADCQISHAKNHTTNRNHDVSAHTAIG